KMPLHIAAEHLNTEIVVLLLKAGSDPCAQTITAQDTPLLIALTHNNPEVAKLLITNANSSIPDFEHNTPLHIAAGNGEITIVEQLLEFNALISSANDSGMTPLHRAAEGYYPQVMELLRKRGANLTVTDQEGRTAHDIFRRLANFFESPKMHQNEPQKSSD